MASKFAFVMVVVLQGVLHGAGAGEGEGYVFRIETAADFDKFSAPERFLPNVERSLKFLMPASAEAKLLPTMYQNVNLYDFHLKFMQTELSDRFPGIEGEEYLTLVERRATRDYFAGIIYRFKGNPEPRYGFDIFTAANNIEELPFREEIRWVYSLLQSTFKLGPLEYSPRRPDAIQNAQSWEDFDVPINYAFGGGLPDYIPYTHAENYGRVKVLTPDEFDEANERGAFGWQDILILSQAPSDIEGVIAGVITGEIQGELGHLAIRTARRGTPNAYVKNPAQAFAAYQGKMVRLKVEAVSYTVTEATLADAEAWWTAHRPKLAEIPEVEAAYDKLDAAWEPPIDGSVKLVTRYGGKGSNFARLYQLLRNPDNRVPGFLIPFYYYIKFMETNRTYAPRDPTRKVTYFQYVEELLADPEFRGSSEKRFQDLERLREIIQDNGLVDEADVRRIAQRVQEIFGRVDKNVRFRSSSNAEDLLEFNAAGLYTSVGGCAGDDLDQDSVGPSVCNPFLTREDGIARSLKEVWASLWNFRAFEEREYFQISHLKTRMAVLCSESFPDEIANGVAFTGNPSLKGDRRFLINAQLGDIEVVFPDPGVVPEKDLLEMDRGQVANILRVRSSTLVPPGQVIVSDAILREMGAVMADIEARLPVDLGTHKPEEVVLDFEFKVDNRDRLRFKQVRPFLIADTGPGAPQFTLKVPSNLIACGSFFEGMPALEVLRTKAQIGLREGDHLLRTDGPSSANLIEWVQLTPDGARIPPEGTGLWEVILTTSGTRQVFLANMRQKFLAPGGSPLWVTVNNIQIGVSDPREIAFDADAITWNINPHNLHIGLNAGAEADFKAHKWFLPCNVDSLPLYFVEVLFTNGDSVRFFERFQDIRDGTGPAELVGGIASLDGTEVSVNDYWRLVYTAGHHNDTPHPEHWMIFDEVREISEVGRVRGVGVHRGFDSEKPRAFYLGEDMSELNPIEIATFRRRKEGEPLKPEFRRGDVDMSGNVTVTDAILILRYNFYGETLRCEDAGDVDDIGTVGPDDAILLLGFLLFGLDPPLEPGPLHCGLDVLEDGLTECEPGACP